MEKRILIGMLVLGSIEMFVGAMQLGLYRLPNAFVIAQVAVTICCVVLALFFATKLGDKLVLKYYGFDSLGGYKRWRSIISDSTYASPGIGLRLVIHVLFQAPFIYHAVLLAKVL